MIKEPAPPKPRGRPRGFDRAEALETAMRLFWSRGFEATSISDLTHAMGINPPALYGAFGDKKRLFLEAVDLYEQGPGCFGQQALTQEPTAEAAVRRLMVDAVKMFTHPDNPGGCMVMSGSTNYTAESDDIREALAERRRFAERTVRARIKAGQQAGELAEDADVDALAGAVTAVLYGLAVKARDGVPRAALLRTVEQSMRMWPRRKRAPASA